MRVLDAESLDVLRCVTFEKATHSKGPVPFERYLALRGAPA